MNKELKILLILLLTFLDNFCFGQMIEGNYPFKIIDSLVFNEDYNLLQINTFDSDTNNLEFSVGISNHSADTIYIPIQDKSVISILEAKDNNGNWNPIQFWPISGCGNSYYSQIISPNQTLLYSVKKDFGEIPTSMRLRLHGTDTIFVSNEFSGTINSNMFKIKENIINEYKHVLCESIFYLESPIHGNLNYDDIQIIEIKDE